MNEQRCNISRDRFGRSAREHAARVKNLHGLLYDGDADGEASAVSVNSVTDGFCQRCAVVHVQIHGDVRGQPRLNVEEALCYGYVRAGHAGYQLRKLCCIWCPGNSRQRKAVPQHICMYP
jgi:hypothetical protein